MFDRGMLAWIGLKSKLQSIMLLVDSSSQNLLLVARLPSCLRVEEVGTSLEHVCT